MQRFGQVIGVRPEHVEEYVNYHANVWPEVLAMIHACNIRNYSIFLDEATHTLFAYFEYIGDDFAGDMANMAADPKTQEWWALMSPMQAARPERQEGEWWKTIPEVFHTK